MVYKMTNHDKSDRNSGFGRVLTFHQHHHHLPDIDSGGGDKPVRSLKIAKYLGC